MAVLVGILLANMMPDGPVSHLAYAQTANSSIEYAENGTAPVGRFGAYDQDGDVVRWSLSGPDDDLFTISGGVLAFKEPPNYEDPQSAIAGNVYRVTIEAAGGTHDVAVTVTDVDEPGTVRIDRLQPQVSRPLGASLEDEDEGVRSERWQWARSEDGTTWTDIERATVSIRRPVPGDEGMFLRATVTYADRFGSGKTASAESVNRVEAMTLFNAPPSFADQDEDEDTPYIDVTRSIAENAAVGTNIGRPVSATDTDDDVLFYELLDTPDLEDDGGHVRFTIDSFSGQIRVGRELGADTGEREDEDSTALSGGPALPDGEDADEANNSEYVLRVRVSDPSTASRTVNVIVRVTSVNEAPEFSEGAPMLLRVWENQDPPVITLENGATPVDANTFAVTDQDDDDDDTSYTYRVTGADRDVLAFDSASVLSFRAGHEPDFEEKKSYSITIVAGSGEGSRRLTATLDVTINVVDAEDVGEVFLSQRQPQVDTEVHATVRDPDGRVTITRWVWELSDEITVDEEGTPSADCREYSGGWTEIGEPSSAVYTPSRADVGRCLRATVIYRDNIANAIGGDEQVVGVTEAPVQSRNPANTAPRFVGKTVRTSRRVAENTKDGQNIGAAISAHDDDGDLLIYTLGGADSASFYISRTTGQLKTKAALDYEVRSRYTMVVTATDPSGASASIPVTVNVTDEDDPAHISGINAIEYTENGTAPVGRFGAYDQDGDAARWSLSGPDDDLFTISGGVLAFKEPPNYEDPQSAIAGNVYRVTIEAAGGTHDVAMTVTDVDEPGTVRIDRLQPQVSRPLGASLADEDEGVRSERWQWARSEDGTTWTDIEGATVSIRRPVPGDEGMFLRATVTYADRFGSGKTASAVSANRVEAMTLFNAAPSFADQDEDEGTPYIDVTRSIAENAAAGTNIGRPVSATDTDDDILFYELLDTPDLEDDGGHVRFTIDSFSGQIRVGRELGADTGEREDEDSMALSGGPALPDGEDADEANNSEYVLRVRVSDPSTASRTVNVIVRVTSVNEAPEFSEDAPTLLRVRENVDPLVITLENDVTPVDANTFAVTDQDGSVDGPDGYDDTTYTYRVTGGDHSVFTFDDEDTLSFTTGRKPDYEKKSSYSITILAHSGEGSRRLTATLDVTIDVVDAEDVGAVLLSQRQPQVGIDIHATASDPDGGVTITKWVWERSTPTAGCGDDLGDWTPIGGASSAVYTPKQADVGKCLRATAIYTDNLDDAREQATAALEVPTKGPGPPDPDTTSERGFVNAAPEFPDQDFLTVGDQSDSTSRQVAENTKAGRNIGDPVSAVDDDGDLLIYTLSGADAASFSIERNSGQLKTRASLNYEARSSYKVVVTATDPSGAAVSILVTINVTDEDDPAVITVLHK